MSELNGFLFITNIVVVLLCSALFPVMPLLTRKSFLFGVKVPPEAQGSGEAKALKRNYITVCIAGGAAVLAASIWQYAAAPGYTMYAVLFFPFVLMAVQLAAFVPNHKKALELKSRLGWNVSELTYADTKSSFTRGNLSAMPHFWYVISLALVFATFVVALVRYPALPDPMPTHWDINMTPDGWTQKSLGAVLFMPIFNICTVAFMWLMGVLLERAKLQIDHNEPEKSFVQHKKYRRLMGHGLGVMAAGIAVMFAGLGLQTVFVGFILPFWLLMVLVIAPSTYLCVVAVKAGQGGVLLKVRDTEIHAGAGGDIAGNNAMSDDRFWAWGLFYHNPDDPACFVGDRFGTSLGFNYSRLPVKIGVTIGVAALVACYVWIIALIRSVGL